MLGLGDAVVLLLSIVALIYGACMMILRKTPLYFQLSMASVGCLLLGYLFDVCDYVVNGYHGDGYMIGYLGSIGSFLFLLAASVGYMDGIMDDGSAQIKKCRWIAWIGPLVAVALWGLNMFSEESLKIKIVYTLVWIPATFSVYYNLKHAILPDMGFGFVKAIRPFNIAAVCFTYLQLIHLTLWCFCDWIPLVISGIVFGSSCIVMVVMADRGVKKWVL